MRVKERRCVIPFSACALCSLHVVWFRGCFHVFVSKSYKISPVHDMHLGILGAGIEKTP